MKIRAFSGLISFNRSYEKMLDAHCEMILDEYRENLPAFAKIKEIVLNELRGFVAQSGIFINIVEGRVKEERSLKGKLLLKGSKYKTLKDITDIVGARVVTFFTDDVDKIAALVEKKFDIDWVNSIDKRKMLNIDQFGYMSLHFICKIPKDIYYDEALPQINEYSFEIQIRTSLQHTWASIHHDTGYKSDVEIPREFHRRFNRLAGLLEMADEEFTTLKLEIDEYRRNVRNIVKSGKFDDIELNGDSFNVYIENGGFDEVTKKIASINNMEIEKVPVQKFISILKFFGFRTLGDVEKFKKDYGELAYKYALVQFEGMDLDIIASNIGLLCTSIVYVIANGMGEAGINQIYKYLYGDQTSNSASVKRAMKIAKKLGIYKEEE